MTGRTTVPEKVKGRCGGSCVTDAFAERARCPVLPVGANRSERESERTMSANDAGADGCQRKVVRFMPECGGGLQKERSPEDAAEGSTE